MKGETMAKKTKTNLPEIEGLRPTERKAVTVRVETDVPEISDLVKELYIEQGQKITNDTIYAQAIREYWGPIVAGRRKAK